MVGSGRQGKQRWAGAWLALGVALGAGSAAALSPPPERCHSGELRHTARFCKAVLSCETRRARRPERDPGGAARDDCVERALTRFDALWEREVVRAFDRGESCGFDGFTSDFVEPELLAPLRVLRDDEILAGFDENDRIETATRATLLAGTGKLCSGLLAAESKDAKRPDSGRLAAKRAKERSRFLTSATRKLERAAARGTPIAGVDPERIADAVAALVDAFAARVEPLAISLSGAVTASAGSVADGDVNDPFTEYVPNDDFGDAQPLPNPAAVGGYVNLRGAGPKGPSRGPGDEMDFYQVSLARGQSVVLFIGDDPAKVDLDLCLYDFPSEFLPLDCSLGVGPVESLTAPFSGPFWIGVLPFSGGSTYVLTVGQQVPAAAGTAMRLSDEFVPGELVVRLSGQPAEDGTPAPRTREEAAGRCGMRAGGGAADREMLFRFEEGAIGPEMALRTLGAEEPRARMHAMARPRSRERALELDTILAAKALARRRDVARADLNRVRRPTRVPNDTYYNLQWHYPLIQLPQAWDLTTGDPDVVVAVIDTGVRFDHPDLAGRLLPGYDFVSNRNSARDGDGIDADASDPGDLANGGSSSFHGTHVAGTVGAASDDGSGIAGVAWNVRLMLLRALGRSGGSVFDVIQAVRYAARLSNDSGSLPAVRADVINLSLGGSGFVQASQDTYAAARAAGSIVVAAAGNDASGAPFYPASYEGVVSVSAVGPQKQRAPYSNFGPDVDAAAPGGDLSRDVNGDGFGDGVLSALADDSGANLAFTYVFYQGTSMAAPHVAGVAALMKSVDPTLDPDRFDALLESGGITEDLGAPGRDDLYGHGLIDARLAVLAASGGSLPPRLVTSPSGLNFGASLGASEVELRNAGDGPLDVLGATVTYDASDPGGWLTTTPQDVDADGLGTWQVLVDRGALADGTYAATVRFESSENDASLAVLMRVGSESDADAGFHAILLLHPTSFGTVAEFDTAVSEGRYPWSFPPVVGARPGNVLAGSYLIVAGTDHDNDGFVCDAGEACGAFPTLDLARPLPFPASSSSVDFDSGFPSALNAGATRLPALVPAGNGRSGFRRSPGPTGVR